MESLSLLRHTATPNAPSLHLSSMATSALSSNPIAEAASSTRLKESDEQPPLKKLRLSQEAVEADMSHAPRPVGPTLSPETSPGTRTSSASSSPGFEDKLKNIFQLTMGKELLRMHEQHRLLELEIAKTQTMLEQIRRCKVVPYPGWDSISQQVTRGSEEAGPLAEDKDGYYWPEYAAPRMIPDGPYTRHYTRWLIPDPRFAPTVIAEQHEVRTFGRSTRNSQLGTMDWAIVNTEAQPARPAQPDLDPMVTRNSSGEWCRLSCPHEKCIGVPFRSIQGLINHSRISHQDKYLSHAQCADQCGTPVELDDETVKAYEALHSKNKPGQSRIVPAKSAMNYDRVPGASAQQKESVNVITPAPKDTKSAEEISRLSRPQVSQPPRVHPFNISGSALPTAPQLGQNEDACATAETPSTTQETPAGSTAVVPQAIFRSVTGCADLPRLSEHLQRKSSKQDGIDLDLQKLTFEANQARDLAKMDLEEEDADELVSPSKKAPQHGPSGRANTKRGKPASSARSRKPAGNRPRVSGMGLPAQSPIPASTSSEPTGAYAPEDRGKGASPLTLKLDSTTPSAMRVANGLQSPDLPNPGLVSDRESIADEEMEDMDFKPTTSSSSLDVDIDDGEDDGDLIHNEDTADARRPASRAAMSANKA